MNVVERNLSGAKCLPGMLRRPEQSEHAVYDYETRHPWESILAVNYFLPIARWLMDTKGRWRPDRIRVLRMVDGPGNSHWWEIAELVVAFAGKDRVEVKAIVPPYTVGAPEGVACSWPTKTDAKKAA